MRRTRLIGTLGVVWLVLLTAAVAAAQGAAEVPRNRTLVSQGWDFYTQVPSAANFNPYAGVLLHQRNSLHYTVNEMLFYTNHNTGKIVPWQGESWSYNPGFTVLPEVFNLEDQLAAASDEGLHRPATLEADIPSVKPVRETGTPS